MVEFCAEHGVAHEVCGKVVVAVTPDEQPRLAELHRRCVANGVDVELIGPERLAEFEPHAAGVAALHVKVTGIADFPGVCRVPRRPDRRRRRRAAARHGGHRRRPPTADGSSSRRPPARSRTTGAVNCAGLQADRVARLFGGDGGGPRHA